MDQDFLEIMTRKEDSLQKRYIYKLFTYAVGVPITVVIQAIIPRGLGPEAYGQFTFLTNFFQKIISFLDSGTSLAFYTKLSKNLNDKSIIRFYGSAVLASGLFIFLLTESSIQLKLHPVLFPDQYPIYIRLGVLFVFFYWVSQLTNKIIDAYGLTVKGELIRLVQQLIALILILGLYYFDYLNLELFFVYNYLSFSILIIGWTVYLNIEGIQILNIPRLTFSEIKIKAKDFWIYSSPLILYSFVGMLVGLFDYWFLQNMAGSVEQGYFGLSYKVAALCMVFTKAMTPPITREFSIAFDQGNLDGMRHLFKRYFPLLYCIAASISVFLVINASEVTFVFGGSEFSGAILPMAIMSLYPIHQTYGQLSGSIFYATESTKLYRNIGVTTMLLGGFLLFFLVAPQDYNGMSLGALGLALKLVIVQFIAVNIQLWFNTKQLGLSFWKYLFHQVYVILGLLFIAYLSEFITNYATNKLIFGLILNGLIYIVIVSSLVMVFPFLIGLNKSDLVNLHTKMKNKFFRKF